MTTPEARCRIEIDRLLIAAGWHVCDCRQANLHATRGLAIREFLRDAGHGDADYLFSVDCLGVCVRAKANSRRIAGLAGLSIDALLSYPHQCQKPTHTYPPLPA